MKKWVEKQGVIIITILTIGLGAMVFTDLFSLSKKREQQVVEAQPMFKQTDDEDKLKNIRDYERRYEQQLKEALEAIVGVGEVKVVVNIDTSEVVVLEKNAVTQKRTTVERDKEGGKRQVEDVSADEKVVIVRQGNEEKPLVLQTKMPEIRGVLIVAKGADQIQVKKWIVEAVTRTLNVPTHRVAVLPKK